MKHEAGADIDSALFAGEVDVDDVRELCGDAATDDMLSWNEYNDHDLTLEIFFRSCWLTPFPFRRVHVHFSCLLQSLDFKTTVPPMSGCFLVFII